MMDAGERIADFLAFLKEAEARYLSAQEDERIADDETQDILHALEFGWYSEERAAPLADTLSGVRRKRRQAKDDMDICGLVTTWVTDNRKTIRSLERLQSDVQTELREKGKRSYNLRTNILNLLDGEREEDSVDVAFRDLSPAVQGGGRDMTRDEMLKVFALMKLAWPKAPMFHADKLKATVSLWTLCLPEVDFLTGIMATIQLCRTSHYPPSIAQMNAAAEEIRKNLKEEIHDAILSMKLDSGKFCATRNEKRAHKFCANHEKTSGKVRKRKLYAAFEVFSDSAGF